MHCKQGLVTVGAFTSLLSIVLASGFEQHGSCPTLPLDWCPAINAEGKPQKKVQECYNEVCALYVEDVDQVDLAFELLESAFAAVHNQAKDACGSDPACLESLTALQTTFYSNSEQLQLKAIQSAEDLFFTDVEDCCVVCESDNASGRGGNVGGDSDGDTFTNGDWTRKQVIDPGDATKKN